MKPITTRRGFSLPEIMVALVVLALLFGTAAMRHGSERSRADSEAMAQVMLAELNAARAQAIATHRPVAVCWPSQGKATCQSFYLREGISKGRITRVTDFSGDFPNGFLAVGFWGTATIDPPADRALGVDPAHWLPADFADYAVIFDAQGKATSNDLPLVDGSYRIVACSSVGAALTKPGGSGLMKAAPSYYKFSRVSAPHTIFIKPDGGISTTAGAPGLTVDAHPFPMDPPAPAAALVKASFVQPTIDTVELQAAPSLATVGTVTREGTLNVKVAGSDPSGDDLFLEWASEKLSGTASDAGYFSRSGRYPMDWDPKSGSWRSSISWVPPDDAAVGDTFKLSFVLSNTAGFKDSSAFAQLNDIEVVDDDLLFATGPLGVYKCHTNGTGFELIMASDKGPSYINVSPDGSKMVWDQSAWDRHDIWVGNLDGTGATQVTAGYPNMGYPQPVWNETGTTIFMAGSSSGKGGVMCVKADGTGLLEVKPRVIGHYYTSSLDVSGDGRYVAAIQHIYSIPGDYTSPMLIDLWLGKLNQSTYPPTVDYWTDVSRLPGGQQVGNSDAYLTFQEVFPSSNQPVLLVRSGGGGQSSYAVSLQDTGAAFTGTFVWLTDEFGKGISDRDITFSGDGTEAVGASSLGGLNLYDWDTTTGSPRLVNRRAMLNSTQWISSVDWR